VKEIDRAGGAKVVKPEVVSGYTWFMGGVDLADQKRSYFECKIETAKWPTHLFLWLIDAKWPKPRVRARLRLGD
jgi:hypothetical protein